MHRTAAPSDISVRVRGPIGLLAFLMAAFVLAALLPATTVAATVRPEALIQFPGDRVAGSGAGRIEVPRGMAASPVSGDIYIVDESNRRIDEFSAWGRFVRAFGWDVVQSGPDDKGTGLEACQEEEDVCQAGSVGSGAGQFGSFGQGGGIAVDAAGNVYATDMRVGHRVQKFSPTGKFLLMFGGGVDHTTGADVCTREDIEVAGDSCGAGVEGTGNSQFRGHELGSYLAVSPDGSTVYVGDRERVQEFGADGVFKGQVTFKALHEESASFPEADEALGLAVDPVSGDLYLIVGLDGFSSVDKRVFRIDPENGKLTGVPLSAPTLGAPTALAADSAGDVYVVDSGLDPGSATILEFDAAGNKLIPNSAEEEAAQKARDAEAKGETVEPVERFGEPPAEGLTIADRAQLFAIATDSGCGSEEDDLYAAYIRQSIVPKLAYVSAFGGPPQDVVKCPPPPAEPPEIGVQYATSVSTDSAVLGAEISPHYGTDTRYYVQYGKGRCSEGACGGREPLAPGALLSSKVSNASLKSGPVFLAGLDAGQTYYYRFVAENSAGLVRGVGGEVGVDGQEGSFTTFGAALPVGEDCENGLFREGFSARLPDCRAYELVSPPDRIPAGDVVAKVNARAFPAELNQSSTDGERFAYSSEFAFGDAAGSPYTSEYMATRRAGEGWSTHWISAPRESKSINNNPIIKVDIEEKAFTADLCSDWLMHDTEPVLSENAIAGFANIYRRQNCQPGADSYDAVTTVKPTESTLVSEYWPELQGFSTDGSRAVFRAGAALGEGAPDLGVSFYSSGSQLYEASEGALRFVCVLPDGSPLEESCSAGTYAVNVGLGSEGRISRVEHAVSGDGSRVYWSGKVERLPGKKEILLFLRENSDRAQSAMAGGKCLEAEEKACSYKVSNNEAQFWTAAEDGSLALYTERTEGAEGRLEKLREFDAATKKSSTIAEGVVGVAGASADLSRFYFVSSKQIGGEGIEGKPNLYLSEEGAVSLVASLANEDTDTGLPPQNFALDPVALQPIQQGARTSGDGRHLIFASLASLTGYDNHDAVTGLADDEIYLYDTRTSKSVCISCNPSGARPTGRQLEGVVGAAAVIPAAENQLYAPKVMTEDGDRVFFDSFEGLVARDTNGKEDLYEWERANSQGACEELGAELYVPTSDGCLSLISSGESEQDSTFLDMSVANGARDVFFKTGASLVGRDSGLIDVYDAREGGGLPEPSSPPVVCEGEACQGAPEAPADSSPASSVFSGPGDLVSVLSGKAAVKRKTPSQLRAQRLASALRACRKIKGHGGVRRRRCEATARKRYTSSANAKSRATKSNKGGRS